MDKRIWIVFLVSSIFLSLITTILLWEIVGWAVIFQILVIFLIGALGEHYVSGKGYYHYTEVNGTRIGNVPIWIPFMWVVVVQGSLVVALLLGFTGISLFLSTGIMAFLLDFLIIEPLLCDSMEFWLWTPVNGGYFSFLPPRFNQFTAPVGNYLVWFGFPCLINWMLGIGVLVIS